MKHRIPAWFPFILLFGAISIDQFLPSVTQADTICKGQPIRSGYVITSEFYTSECPDPSGTHHPNAWNIRPPTSPMGICMGSPIPSGYVVTSEFYTGACPHSPGSFAHNAMTIRTPTSGMTICMASPIPSGYVITAQGGYTSECPDPSGTHSRNTLTIRTPTSGMGICMGSAIPSGYVITGQPYYTGDCPDPSGTRSPNACVIVTSATQPTLASIEVTPANSSIAPGVTKQFIATGRYTDNTTKILTTAVTWTSSNAAIATISNAAGSNGQATSVAAGQTTIKAVSGSISGATSLTVTSVTPATLASIEVTPANSSIAPGVTKQFIATGRYTDNTTKILTTAVTWTSSNAAIATISNAAGSNGRATSVAAGQTTIKAISGSISATTSLIVTSAPTPPTLAMSPSFRDLKIFILKSHPETFRFNVRYDFFASRTNHDNTYQIEIKVIPEGAPNTAPSLAPPSLLNYAASQGIQLISGQEYRYFTGTLTVNVPPQAGLPQYDRLRFTIKVQGGPPTRATTTVTPLFRPAFASKGIVLGRESYSKTLYRPECTGVGGAKNDLGRNEEMRAKAGWIIGQSSMTLNRASGTATAVGQEIKYDSNTAPVVGNAVGGRGVRWVVLPHVRTLDVYSQVHHTIHWWCEGFSNKQEGNTYEFRFTVNYSTIEPKVVD